MPSAVRRSAVALSLLAVAACGHEVTAATKPATVVSGSASVPSATVGTALATAPTFIVKDASGNAIANVAVSISVASGGGSIANAPTKTSAGATSVGTWTLGTTAGSNTLAITVSGLSTPLTITATGTAGPASKVAIVSGGSQAGAGATALPTPVVVKVTDQFGNGIPGQPVTFAVTAGGGSLSGSASATSDANGNATAPAWTLGKTNVAQTLTATSGSSSVAVPATIATNYNVQVRFWGGTPDANITAAFNAAVARITAIATGQLSSINLASSPFNVDANCGTTGVGSLSETITGLVIYASVQAIDGPGGKIGSAGPCAQRNSTLLPAIGVMQFDVADFNLMLTNGILTDVVTHEMLHTVGFGSIWDNSAGGKNLVVNPSTANVGFTGAQAIAACMALPGGGASKCQPAVPLTFGVGPGSDNSHWREQVFGNELMTHQISGSPNPLSTLTIASLADIGYTVNLAVADAYTIPSAALADLWTLRNAQGLGLPADWSDEMRRGGFLLDHIGRTTKIVR